MFGRKQMEITVIYNHPDVKLILTRDGVSRTSPGKIDQGSVPHETVVLDELRQLFKNLSQK